MQRPAEDRSHFARHAEVIHRVRPVASDVELEDSVAVRVFHGVDSHAGHRQGMGEVAGRFLDLHEVPQPAEQNAHLSKLS